MRIILNQHCSRSLCFIGILCGFDAVSLGQQNSLQRTAEPATVASPTRTLRAGRTLDDLRNSVNQKQSSGDAMSIEGQEVQKDGISKSFAGSGYFGMASGGGAEGGMAGMPGAAASGGADGGYAAGGYGLDDATSDKRQLASLVQQLRGRLASKKFKRESVEKQLRAALQQYFDADMQERVKEFDKVKARVVEMESKLQRRLDSESEIVELQLKQFLHKADGLELSVTTGSNSSFGGMGSGMSMGMGSSMGGAMGEGSGMGGGYGDMGIAADPTKMGYDVSFAMTGILRPDPNALDDTDPLDAYAESESVNAPDQVADNDADKLRGILLAFHAFESRFAHLPRSSNRYAKDQPPHSWRVAILPLIGHSDLYQAYQFDQPWDSEANLAVAKKMPQIYRSSNAGESATSFLMIVGGGALDSAKSPPRFVDITDGSSNTIALVHSTKEIPWTKPEDVAYNADGALPALSRSGLVAMTDGIVRTIDKIKNEDFRAMITRAGGEVIESLRQ